MPVHCMVDLYTYPAEMGEAEAKASGFLPHVIGSIQPGATNSADTKRAALELIQAGVELILFVGGDGTARDICEVIHDRHPVLGIPGGVKIHSSVYAINPTRGAELVMDFLREQVTFRAMEVMDIDEDLFRSGRVTTRLYGYLKVPFQQRLLQRAKAGSIGSGENLTSIALAIVDRMEKEPDTYFILGTGTTVKAIGEEIGIDKTLLGVDVVCKKRLIGKDLNERQLVDLINGKRTKIVVTVIGGQGYIFGRGNQQISPKVIRMVGKDNIIIIATQQKLLSLVGPLYVDTGDADLDQSLTGYTRVITGYRDETVWKIEC